MPIQVPCPNPGCGKSLAVKEEHQNRLGKCPACGSIFALKAHTAPPRRLQTSRPVGPPNRSNAVTRQAPAGPPTAPSAQPDPDLVVDVEVVEDTTTGRIDREGVDVVGDPEAPRRRWRPPPPRLDEVEQDHDPRRRRRGGATASRSDWARVNEGLHKIHRAVCCALIAMLAEIAITVLALLGMIIAQAAGLSPEDPEGPSLLSVLLRILFLGIPGGFVLATLVYGFWGLALGCYAPRAHGTRSLAFITLVLAAVSLMTGSMLWLLLVADVTGPLLWQLASALGWHASWLCFLFYLRGLSVNLGAGDLTRSLLGLIVGQSVYAAVYMVLWPIGVIAATGASSDHAKTLASVGPMLAVLLVALAIFWFALFAWFMNRLVATSEMIERRQLGGGSSWPQTPAWAVLFGILVGLIVLAVIALAVIALVG